MFNLFGNKAEKLKIIDKVWINETCKLNACRSDLKQSPKTIAVVWFEETFAKAASALQSMNGAIEKLYYSRQLTSQLVQHSSLVFLEHYPLHSKEEELFHKLQIKKAIIYSSLDEPLFKHFGGDKIISLVKQLGVNENEAIEHSLVSSSIKNAQNKIAEKVAFEQPSRSQADWLMKNVTA